MFMSSVYILTLLQVCLVFGELVALTEISPENATVQQQIVDLHNAFRRAVEPTASNMLMMSWSEEVAASAQKWVSQCALRHGPPSSRMVWDYQCGENLFLSDSIMAWSDVVGAWHSEVKNYQYPSGSKNGGQIGHYTQVVWYGSYKVGCGVAACENSIYFYGCQYFRAGNFRGVPPYTAGPPCGECPNNCEDKLCTNPCPYTDKYRNCPQMMQEGGCGNTFVKAWCPALCECQNKIKPVARK
ncbi:cysteine-rich venom protein [Scleropages formosus]|uniref:cysteine-rich venom protein n=1 Tax=Scleropages formosus TaxID=113540 RepID=UPI0010FAB38E|nr:cysteine-rich venom protein-like [Scleropages formosus]